VVLPSATPADVWGVASFQVKVALSLPLVRVRVHSSSNAKAFRTFHDSPFARVCGCASSWRLLRA
jgi:hypothetical protein